MPEQKEPEENIWKKKYEELAAQVTKNEETSLPAVIKQEFVNLSPVSQQVVRIREAFKTLNHDHGFSGVRINVPNLEDNFLEAFRAVANNLDSIIRELNRREG